MNRRFAGADAASAADLRRWMQDSQLDLLEERYDTHAALYEKGLSHGQVLARIAGVVSAIGVPPKARILDAGAGTGLVGEALSRQGFVDLAALDISQGMLNEARKKGVYTSFHKQFLGETLAFGDSEFDAILCIETFHHSHTSAPTLDEFCRIVRPGGHVLFTLHGSKVHDKRFYDRMAHLEQAGRWTKIKTLEDRSYLDARSFTLFVFRVSDKTAPSAPGAAARAREELGDRFHVLSPPVPDPLERVALDAGRVAMLAAQEMLLEQVPLTANVVAKIDLTPGRSVDSGRLARAIVALVDRHPTLRASFDGQSQRIAPPATAAAWPILARAAAAIDLALVDRESASPFDPASPPLFRVTPELASSAVLVTLSPLIADRRSANVLAADLAALYDESSDPLPPLALDCPTWAGILAAVATRQHVGAELDHWARTLRDDPVPPFQHPFVGEVPPDTPVCARLASIAFSATEIDSLRSFSARRHVPVLTTIMATYRCLLFRYTREQDLVLAAIAEPSGPAAGLIGPLDHVLLLRSTVSSTDDHATVVARESDVVGTALDHATVPFLQIAARCALPAGALHTLFCIDDRAPTTAAHHLQPWFPFVFTVVQTPATIELHLAFDQATMAEDSANRLLSHFRTLLSVAALNSGRPVFDFPILTRAERNFLTTDVNSTQRDFADDKCIHQLFEAAVVRFPKRVAVSFEGETITYADLNARANQLAHYLSRLGVGPEVLVGLYMDRSAAMVVGLLGILKAGGAYVPLDPLYPPDRIAFMISDAKISVIVSQESLLERLPRKGVRLVSIDSDWDDIQESESTNRTIRALGAKSRAYVIFTSGSTGRPKGVQIAHRALVNLVAWAARTTDLGPGDVLLAVTTICFDIAGLEMYAPLVSGATLEIAPASVAADGKALLDLLRSAKTTVMQATPITWKLLSRAGWSSDDAPGLKVLCGGEALPPHLARDILDRTDFLVNVYGPTETTIWSTAARITRESLDSGITIGRPIDNTHIYVLDTNMRLVPVGVPGELHIAGAGVAVGYLNRPQLNLEKFVENPYSDLPGDGLYKTNDLVVIRPSGDIEFLGRLDNQVKIRGYRIELGEIEAAITDAPLVAECVVVADHLTQMDEPSSDDDDDAAAASAIDVPSDKQLVAFVVEKQSGLAGTGPDTDDDEEEASRDDMAEVAQWGAIYDEAYADRGAINEDPTLNFSGYDDTYTRKPHEVEVVREWVEHTCKRILAERPRSVLEMGCGNGMILFRVAPNVDHYTGADLSAEAVSYVRQMLGTPPFDHRHVDVLQRGAEDFSGLEDQSFDSVVVNGVIMYFPSAAYLMRVIEGAVRLVSPSAPAHIFLGDVRCFPLIGHFHAGVQLFQADGALSVRDLRNRVDLATRFEKELLVDPELFYHLPDTFEGVSHVRVQLKRGKFHSEFSKFRFDISVFVGDAAFPVHPLQEINAATDMPTLAQVRAELVKMRAAADDDAYALQINAIPNSRVIKEEHLLGLLRAPPSGMDTVDDLREALESYEPYALDPEDLYLLAEELGLDAEITFDRTKPHLMVARFVDLDKPSVSGAVRQPLRRLDATIALESRTNKDAAANKSGVRILSATRRPPMRDELAARLPAYMIPAFFVVLNEFPLTPNGKIDRKKLPALDQVVRDHLGGDDDGDDEDPDDDDRLQTETEVTLGKFWSQLFGIRRVLASSNFFDLGGHSLLATRLIGQTRTHFGVALHLRNIAENPTLREMAAFVDDAAGNSGPGSKGSGTGPSASGLPAVDVVSNLPHKVVVQEAMIPMPDGIRLYAKIWLPEESAQGDDRMRVPAILEYLPYAARDVTALEDSMTHPFYAGHGYAAVRVDLRGLGESEGLYVDEYTDKEQLDAIAVIAWIADQPWCDGAVGMMGLSWGGFNSLQVAARRPAHLKAIMTLCATDDRYADDMHYMGGAALTENVSWASVMLMHASRAPDPAVHPDTWRDLWQERLSELEAPLQDWLSHRSRDGYWKRGSVSEDYTRIRVPVYAIGGWEAGGYCNAVPRLLANLSVPRRGLVGPWAHQYPHISPIGPQAGFLQESLLWWDRWLRKKANSVMDGPMLRMWVKESPMAKGFRPAPTSVGGPGRWIASRVPLKTANKTQLFLNARGCLDVAPDQSETEVMVNSPLSTGATGGEWFTFGVSPDLPTDQRSDDGKSTTFETLPVREPVEIIGAPQVRLNVELDEPNITIIARLCDVSPDGTSARITYGVLRMEAVKVGTAITLTVPFNLVAYVVPVGHRLRLALSTQYWPILWPRHSPAVRIKVGPSESRLVIPRARPERGAREVPPPLIAPPVGMSVIRKGRSERTIAVDVASGTTTIRSLADGGVVRLADTRLEHGAVFRKEYAVQEVDSASALMVAEFDAVRRRRPADTGDTGDQDHVFDTRVEGSISVHATEDDGLEAVVRVRAFEAEHNVFVFKSKFSVAGPVSR